MDHAQLAKTQRQIVVRGRPALGDEDVAGTAHRLHRRFAGLILDPEHAVEKVLPVPARLPNRSPHNLRRSHFLIAVGAAVLPDGLFQQTVEDQPARQSEHHAGRLFAKTKQI
jgi:hypothetical protein